jgi:hypothetical protein
MSHSCRCSRGAEAYENIFIKTRVIVWQCEAQADGTIRVKSGYSNELQ